MARWPLGGMRFQQIVECEIDEAAHLVRWHERFIENGWGVPPPMIDARSAAVRGKGLSGRRSWTSPFGSGSVDYGAVRGAAEAAVAAAGWRFELRLLPDGSPKIAR